MSAMGFAVRIAVALAFAAFLSWKFNFINGIGLAIALLLFLSTDGRPAAWRLLRSLL